MSNKLLKAFAPVSKKRVRQHFVSSNQSPLILSIETASRAGGSLALKRGAHLLALRAGEAGESQTQSLLPHIESLFAETGLALSDVELFAAAVGPGSFTGLRTGLATVKALAATLARPCVGIPTLHAVACAAGNSASTVAMIPAGRNEVYAQLLRVASNLDVTELDAARHTAPQILFEQVKNLTSLIWAGESAHVYAGEIEAYAKAQEVSFVNEAATAKNLSRADENKDWRIAPAIKTLAVVVAELALRRFRCGRSHGPEELRAIYVRASDAELNEKCRAQKTPSK